MKHPLVSQRRWNGPALLLIAGIVVVMSLIALPVLLREEARDWTAYEQAADRLVAGEPLYVWELATEEDEYYLYPPGMAAAWAVAGSPELLLLVKLAALLGVGTLAPLVVGDPRRHLLGGVLLVGAALVWPPNIHDLVLGNVMVLYVGAVSIAVARRGWKGVVPLGLVLALAAKPAVLPFLIWLVLRYPRDAGRVVLVAAAASLAFAAAFGPGRYLEYLAALPQMTAVARDFTGNVGLVTVSPIAGYLGIGASWIVAAFAGWRLDLRRGAAIAIATMVLAQPTIGFNYAGLLLPAMALLWGRDRIAGTAAFVVGVPLMLVAPWAAVVVVVGLTFVSWWLAPSSKLPA